jgi:cleavage and polyadenylation specificity factor subunit 3
MSTVDVKQTGEHDLILEWDSSASNDMIADSTLALITGIDKSPASAKRTAHLFSNTEKKLFILILLLLHSNQ